MPRHKTYVPHGVIPAVLLPFDADLAIDEASFRKHLRDVAATDGITAITINAHSTEVASCTFEEQRRVLDIAQDEIGDRLPLINGIWADGSLEAARLARMAAEGGASALLVFPPAPFTLGQSPQMALAHFKRIADATDLPLIAFQYPLATGQGYPQGHAAEAVRGGADHPRHQGLDRQRAAARVARAHAAEPAAAGERALHPQRLAALLARARLQRPAVGQRQRHPRPAGAAVPGRAGATISPRRRRLNDRIEPLMRVFYADPFVDMHNRMKEALVLLGRLPRAYVRPPLVKIGAARDRAHPRRRWSRPACSARTPRATRPERRE